MRMAISVSNQQLQSNQRTPKLWDPLGKLAKKLLFSDHDIKTRTDLHLYHSSSTFTKRLTLASECSPIYNIV